MIEVLLHDREDPDATAPRRVVLPSVPQVGDYVSLNSEPLGLRLVQSVTWVVPTNSVVVEVARSVR